MCREGEQLAGIPAGGSIHNCTQLHKNSAIQLTVRLPLVLPGDPHAAEQAALLRSRSEVGQGGRSEHHATRGKVRGSRTCRHSTSLANMQTYLSACPASAL